MKEIWLSPSDLSYFWSDSKVGFYDKYVLQIQRPKQAFPSVFNTIDLTMKDCFDKVDSSTIVKGAPQGKITHEEIHVQSKLITLGDYKIGFKGKIDCLLASEDDTYYVVDYKTTHISEKLQNIYFLQLMAYAYCLENPLVGQAKKISGLGLIVFQPSSFEFMPGQNKASLNGELAWVKINFDKNKFKLWLKNDLQTLLHAPREKLFVSGMDKSWEKYVGCFSVEED